LDLLAEVGTVTSTEAARRLGRSSGLCSFHLRQLARHGMIEEAPHGGGRGGVRPWRLRWEGPAAEVAAPVDFGAVVRLTPAELAELSEAVRALVAGYQSPGRPAGAGALAVEVAVRVGVRD
jgi:hypothetical protein